MDNAQCIGKRRKDSQGLTGFAFILPRQKTEKSLGEVPNAQKLAVRTTRKPFMPRHLRLFVATKEEIDSPSPEPIHRVTLGDLLPLVALASRRNYAWLQDFLDDDVLITDDLNDILQTFRAKPSA